MHCWKHTNSSVPLKIRPHLLCLLYLKKEKYRNAFLWCSMRRAGLTLKPIGINGETRTDTSGLPGQSSSPPAGLQKDHLSEKALGHTRRHILALKFHAAVGGDLRCQIFYPLMNFHRSWDSPFERLSKLVWVSTTWSKIYSSDPFTPTEIVKLGPKQLSEAQIRSVSQFYSSRCPKHKVTLTKPHDPGSSTPL